MHPADINAVIRKKRMTQKKIADGLSVSQPAVSAVINGRRRSRRIAREIAHITGISLSDLWPGKYIEF